MTRFDCKTFCLVTPGQPSLFPQPLAAVSRACCDLVLPCSLWSQEQEAVPPTYNTQPAAVVTNLPNTATLDYNSSCWGDPQP